MAVSHLHPRLTTLLRGTAALNSSCACSRRTTELHTTCRAAYTTKPASTRLQPQSHHFHFHFQTISPLTIPLLKTTTLFHLQTRKFTSLSSSSHEETTSQNTNNNHIILLNSLTTLTSTADTLSQSPSLLTPLTSLIIKHTYNDAYITGAVDRDTARAELQSSIDAWAEPVTRILNACASSGKLEVFRWDNPVVWCTRGVKRPGGFWEAVWRNKGLRGVVGEFYTWEVGGMPTPSTPSQLPNLTHLHLHATSSHGCTATPLSNLLTYVSPTLTHLTLTLPTCDMPTCRILDMTWPPSLPELVVLHLQTVAEDPGPLTEMLENAAKLEMVRWDVDEDDEGCMDRDSDDDVVPACLSPTALPVLRALRLPYAGNSKRTLSSWFSATEDGTYRPIRHLSLPGGWLLGCEIWKQMLPAAGQTLRCLDVGFSINVMRVDDVKGYKGPAIPEMAGLLRELTELRELGIWLRKWDGGHVVGVEDLKTALSLLPPTTHLRALRIIAGDHITPLPASLRDNFAFDDVAVPESLEYVAWECSTEKKLYKVLRTVDGEGRIKMGLVECERPRKRKEGDGGEEDMGVRWDWTDGRVLEYE